MVKRKHCLFKLDWQLTCKGAGGIRLMKLMNGNIIIYCHCSMPAINSILVAVFTVHPSESEGRHLSNFVCRLNLYLVRQFNFSYIRVKQRKALKSLLRQCKLIAVTQSWELFCVYVKVDVKRRERRIQVPVLVTEWLIWWCMIEIYISLFFKFSSYN